MCNHDSSHSGKNRIAFVPTFNSVSLRVTWRVTTREGLRTEITHSDRVNLPSQEILAQEDAVESNFLLFQKLTTNPFVQMIDYSTALIRVNIPFSGQQIVPPGSSNLRPLLCAHWASEPQLLKPVYLEPVLHKRSPRNEKPVHRNKD